MKKNKGKQPKIAIQVSDRKGPKIFERVPGTKEPAIAERVDFMHLKAAWRVNRIQMVDPYGWHVITSEQINHIREKLSDFETMTWHEIFTVAKKRNHRIPVCNLRCPKARQWMKMNMPDQTELWTLRFTGAERVWGIFGEGAYQIVFWDPSHQILPTLQ